MNWGKVPHSDDLPNLLVVGVFFRFLLVCFFSFSQDLPSGREKFEAVN